MEMLSLALFTILPARRAIVAAAVAGLAAPLARVLPVEAAAPSSPYRPPRPSWHCRRRRGRARSWPPWTTTAARSSP